jgi:hypothetical protein
MDVKSAFLNGFINELVYVEQPPRFEDPRYPNHAYRLSNALYGLKGAPRSKRASRSGPSTQLYSQRNITVIFSFVRFMLMI